MLNSQINLEFEEGATGKWRELPTQGFLEFRLRKRERKRENYRERKRERERERQRDRETEREKECVCVCVREGERESSRRRASSNSGHVLSFSSAFFTSFLYTSDVWGKAT